MLQATRGSLPVSALPHRHAAQLTQAHSKATDTIGIYLTHCVGMI